MAFLCTCSDDSLVGCICLQRHATCLTYRWGSSPVVGYMDDSICPGAWRQAGEWAAAAVFIRCMASARDEADERDMSMSLGVQRILRVGCRWFNNGIDSAGNRAAAYKRGYRLNFSPVARHCC